MHQYIYIYHKKPLVLTLGIIDTINVFFSLQDKAAILLNVLLLASFTMMSMFLATMGTLSLFDRQSAIQAIA